MVFGKKNQHRAKIIARGLDLSPVEKQARAPARRPFEGEKITPDVKAQLKDVKQSLVFSMADASSAGHNHTSVMTGAGPRQR